MAKPSQYLNPQATNWPASRLAGAFWPANSVHLRTIRRIEYQPHRLLWAEWHAPMAADVQAW